MTCRSLFTPSAGQSKADSSSAVTWAGSDADDDRMKRSLVAASASGLRAARARIAWCIVGTAVYQVGRASQSHWKKRSALKPGVQNTLPPAANDDSTAQRAMGERVSFGCGNSRRVIRTGGNLLND